MQKRNTHLICGYGEIGKALARIVPSDVMDVRREPPEEQYAVLHICFPYSDAFVKSVQAYQKRFSPALTVIHATVPVGISKKLGAVHSPIRGVHPNLEQGIRTFVKYFGGPDAEKAAAIFRDLGLRVKTTPRAETTEAAKLWDTTAYGVMIMLEKEIHRFAEAHDLDFDLLYRDFTQTYNEGYAKLGMPHVARPYLSHMAGPIGGHCVIPNARILSDHGSFLADLLLKKNEEYKKQK